MTKPLVTAHTIVRNEERFLWYAITSVIDHVDHMLIYDTGSTDKTVAIIKSFSSPKISFSQKGTVNAKQLVELRNQQILATDSHWLLNLDGDEIYPQAAITELIATMKTAPPHTLGIATPFINFAGDIYHQQSRSKGRYNIAGHIGHINIRGIRLSPKLTVTGAYPNETYCVGDRPVQHLTKQLVITKQPFFHAGDLPRSPRDRGVLARKHVIDRGLPLSLPHPEVFSQIPPITSMDIHPRRSLIYEILATIKSWVKK